MNNNSQRLLRRLGRTGVEVNALGLGGHTYPVGYGPDSFISPEDRSQIIHTLVSSGVNYFDTTYFKEMELLIDSFRRANIRENVIISLYGGSIATPQWKHNLRLELESRLALLGYSPAPLFLVSVGDGNASHAEIISACEAMRRLKDENLVRNIGLSCHALNLFPVISRIIRETDLIDYIMIRFNWKYQQANNELFPVAEEHNVGIVGMKLFYWDCSPAHWNMGISVFENADPGNRTGKNSTLSPAQRHIIWCLQNSPCDVVVPAMNTMKEARENVQALRSIDAKVGTSDFVHYSTRLWEKKELKNLALYAESSAIRNRAVALLKPRRELWHRLIRTIGTHYRILRNEGILKYLLYSYLYRKKQLLGKSDDIGS